MAFANFFCKAEDRPQREEQDPQGGEHAVPPEVPQGAENGAEKTEKQHGAPQSPDYHVHPQFPVPKGQGKVEQGGQHRHGIQAVQDPAGPPAENQTEGAQQVVEKAQQQPQEDGGQKGRQLLGDIDPHQPNSRPKSRDFP